MPKDGKFVPYYDRLFRCEVTSQRHQDKLIKSFRSESHPQGIYPIRDDKKFLKEMAQIQKDREGYKAATLPGYKPKTERELNEIRQKYGGERAFDPNRPDMDERKHRS